MYPVGVDPIRMYRAMPDQMGAWQNLGAAAGAGLAPSPYKAKQRPWWMLGAPDQGQNIFPSPWGAPQAGQDIYGGGSGFDPYGLERRRLHPPDNLAGPTSGQNIFPSPYGAPQPSQNIYGGAGGFNPSGYRFGGY